MSKNTQWYYTTKHLISDLLSNTPNCYVCAGEFRRHLFTGNAWQKYAKRNGIVMGNPANWFVNSWSTMQTGFGGFDQAITGQFISLFTTGKILSFNHPNYRSIQVFHFKISVQTKPRKQIHFDKQNQSKLLARCQKTCLTSPLEYKYRVIFVLVLGIICAPQSTVGNNSPN